MLSAYFSEPSRVLMRRAEMMRYAVPERVRSHEPDAGGAPDGR